MAGNHERSETRHAPWDSRPEGGSMELPESIRLIINAAIRKAMKK